MVVAYTLGERQLNHRFTDVKPGSNAGSQEKKGLEMTVEVFR